MYNPYLVIPLITWAIAQTLKFIVAALRGKVDLKYFYASGGMPSVHSAVVCALATTALILDGPGSQYFGLTALFAAIVMYDSFGVRRASGEQAAAINMLIASLGTDRVKLSEPHLKLREILGHKPLEVSLGAVLGIVLGCLFNVSHLTTQLSFLTALPGRLEFAAYLLVFGIILVLGTAARFLIGWRWPKSLAMARLGRDVLLAAQSIGWLGLILAFAQYEHASYVSWRAWPELLLIVFLIWGGILISRYGRMLPVALAGEAEKERKARWLPKPKKSKAKR